MTDLPRGPGRPPGRPNKITSEIRDAIANAFTKVGGEDYLVVQARENPVAFLSLLGKILPKDITVTAELDIAGLTPPEIAAVVAAWAGTQPGAGGEGEAGAGPVEPGDVLH